MEMTSAQRKLDRGVEQVKTLRSEAEAFVDADAYRFRVDGERRSPKELFCRCFAVERYAPPPHWPLLAGEAVQNLRSALDHAVWSVASKRDRDRTQFPIFTDPCEFQVLGARMLKGVPKPIRALIEEAQPYRRLPQRPALHALEWLRTLSNIDKHRALHTVAAFVSNEFIGIGSDIDIKWHKLGTYRDLGHGETEVSSFTATSEREFEDVEVQPAFSYQVRIEARPLDHLVSVAQRVFECVTEVETGEPISPGAAYPIYPGF